MAATTAKPVKSAGKIPGSTLKIIAMVCMLIDHTAAVLFDRILISRGLLDAVNASDGGASFLSTGNTAVIYYADMIMRAIGRISFPIFCFLLIEGFMHTHDVKKYALNLGIFALVSEIPFDLAFAGKPFYLDYQNVFFTLFIGLVMMIFLQKIDSKAQKDAGAWQRANWKVSVGKLLVIVAACAVATLLKTDYSAMGILTIVLMYNMRKNKMYCIGIGCAVLTLLSLNEITCFLAMIPVHFYNGKRGLNLKYPFYAFYPVHLLVLFAIAAVLGIAGVAVFKNPDPGRGPCAAWDCAVGNSPRRHRRTSGLTLRRAVGRSGFAAQIGVRFYLIYFLTSNGYPKSSSLRITSKFSG